MEASLNGLQVKAIAPPYVAGIINSFNSVSHTQKTSSLWAIMFMCHSPKQKWLFLVLPVNLKKSVPLLNF